MILLILACGSPVQAPVPAPVPAPIAKPLAVPPGAMGVVVREGDDLRVVFPAGEVPGFDPVPAARQADLSPSPIHAAPPVPVGGELVLFDAEGALARVPPPLLETRFWCESDGGVQYRLDGRLGDPPQTARPLAPLPDADGIVAFVRVGEGPLEASLARWPDEAICEDGNLGLKTARGTAPLRCCGP